MWVYLFLMEQKLDIALLILAKVKVGRFIYALMVLLAYEESMFYLFSFGGFSFMTSQRGILF